MLFHLPYLGEILSLLCAIIWASAVIFFKKSGETVSPLGLNLFKNVLALVLLMPTSLALGITLAPKTSLSDYLLLLISGISGIALSDTLFFRSLNLLGAELSAIVDCLYSPFIIVLSVFFLREDINGLKIFGVLLIVSAVFAVSRKENRKNISRHDLGWGILLGILAMALVAVGIVMIKPLLDHTSLLCAVEVRLVAGCLGLGLFLIFHPHRQNIVTSVLSVRNWQYMLPGSFLGAYLATVIWMGGMKYTQASIASALNQTSNIFIFVLAAIFLKEPVTFVRVVAIILAFAGAVIVSFG